MSRIIHGLPKIKDAILKNKSSLIVLALLPKFWAGSRVPRFGYLFVNFHSRLVHYPNIAQSSENKNQKP